MYNLLYSGEEQSTYSPELFFRSQNRNWSLFFSFFFFLHMLFMFCDHLYISIFGFQLDDLGRIFAVLLITRQMTESAPTQIYSSIYCVQLRANKQPMLNNILVGFVCHEMAVFIDYPIPIKLIKLFCYFISLLTGC